MCAKNETPHADVATSACICVCCRTRISIQWLTCHALTLFEAGHFNGALLNKKNIDQKTLPLLLKPRALPECNFRSELLEPKGFGQWLRLCGPCFAIFLPRRAANFAAAAAQKMRSESTKFIITSDKRQLAEQNGKLLIT